MGQQILGNISRNLLIDGCLPIVFDPVKSTGCFLADKVTGSKYLDFFGQFGSMPLTYNHPGLRETDFENKILLWARHKIANSDILSEALSDFITIFRDIAMPQGFEDVFFISGGALAVENALKVAFDWKVRKNFSQGKLIKPEELSVVYFKDAFHGRSGYTLSLTNTSPHKIKFFPKFTNWKKFTLPQTLWSGIFQRNFSQYLSKNKDYIPAVIVEPIQCEGGDIHISTDIHQYLREITESLDILLIYDEVQTGGGATGKFWCFEHFGVLPDLVSFGKKIQVCGCLARGDKMDMVKDNVFRDPGRINSTWGANIVDFVRSERILEIIFEGDLLNYVQQTGDEVLKELQHLSAKHNIIANVRGKGFIIAFDLPTEEIRDKVIGELFKSHVLVLPCGQVGIRLRPPLDTPQECFDEFFQKLDQVLYGI